MRSSKLLAPPHADLITVICHVAGMAKRLYVAEAIIGGVSVAVVAISCGLGAAVALFQGHEFLGASSPCLMIRNVGLPEGIQRTLLRAGSTSIRVGCPQLDTTIRAVLGVPNVPRHIGSADVIGGFHA